MTPSNFDLIHSGLFFILGLIETSSHLLLLNNVGQNVTLMCKCQDANVVMCFWYKQTLGEKPLQVSSYYKHNLKGSLMDKFKGNPRFSLDNNNNDNNLQISNLEISDTATYFCVSSNLYSLNFLEGITVNVNGAEADITTLVHEPSSGNSEPKTLDCTFDTGTCDGQQSVYWLRKYNESGAGVIYTEGGSNGQCERNMDSKANSCVYNVPFSNVNRSNDWTKCAVASCGRVLFGDKMDSGEKGNSSTLVCVLSGALGLTTIFIVSLAFSLYKVIKRNRQTPSTVTTEEAENLHYAALHHKSHKSRKQNNSTNTDCVYSSVRL